MRHRSTNYETRWCVKRRGRAVRADSYLTIMPAVLHLYSESRVPLFLAVQPRHLRQHDPASPYSFSPLRGSLSASGGFAGFGRHIRQMMPGGLANSWPSSHQTRFAFRAAGYTPPEVESFTKVVELRISALNEL